LVPHLLRANRLPPPAWDFIRSTSLDYRPPLPTGPAGTAILYNVSILPANSLYWITLCLHFRQTAWITYGPPPCRCHSARSDSRRGHLCRNAPAVCWWGYSAVIVACHNAISCHRCEPLPPACTGHLCGCCFLPATRRLPPEPPPCRHFRVPPAVCLPPGWLPRNVLGTQTYALSAPAALLWCLLYLGGSCFLVLPAAVACGFTALPYTHYIHGYNISAIVPPALRLGWRSRPARCVSGTCCTGFRLTSCLPPLDAACRLNTGMPPQDRMLRTDTRIDGRQFSTWMPPFLPPHRAAPCCCVGTSIGLTTCGSLGTGFCLSPATAWTWDTTCCLFLPASHTPACTTCLWDKWDTVCIAHCSLGGCMLEDRKVPPARHLQSHHTCHHLPAWAGVTWRSTATLTLHFRHLQETCHYRLPHLHILYY